MTEELVKMDAEKLSIFKQSSNQKVLLMLSGGKDSSACLNILNDMGCDVTAIHFTHQWGSKISTHEAVRICKQLGVSLIEVDFSDELFSSIKGYRGGRPCLICKPKMYEIVIKEVLLGSYGWVCIGDNADDKTTIVRIMNHIQDKNSESKFCNTYFGSERGIVLPTSVQVLRPILDLTSEEVETYLASQEIQINKNNSTGDKYFEYAREGCPVQFQDPGYEINLQTLNDLHKYNTALTTFAKEKNIRASVHLPSTFVVTIPTGFELEAAHFLEKNGLVIDWDLNANQNISTNIILISIWLSNQIIYDNLTYKILYSRFMERLDYIQTKNESIESDNSFIDIIYHKSGYVTFKYIRNTKHLTIEVVSNQLINDFVIENLVVEIFRTRKYKLL